MYYSTKTLGELILNLGDFKTSVSELDPKLYLIAHFDDDLSIQDFENRESELKIIFNLGTENSKITLSDFMESTIDIDPKTNLYIQSDTNIRLIFGYHLRGEKLILE